ncbi:GNAT family N-acetyltransferase [Jeotgalibaca sp. MA1X17-3]|uniref:GNAT family N-acetyltransferase n=1 Tax=Jeotgalibaca sp. MA1X17-3 TaxID=2908211 RepID=UPI001F3EFC66|nr:GNAT family N-acetyltransferase [Jeotgalibaca sp. MA1X17-3]UJF15907.1 GNAT family N-acetyltransferase [Jeotgalibaca sp. MA1X17-3]
MEQTKIRIAERKDAPLIFSFIKDLAHYEKMENEMVATVGDIEASIFDRKEAEVLLLEYQGNAIGFALFFHNYSTFLGKAGLYLEDLFVNPEYRGNGYGKMLFQRVVAIAKERGAGRMEWTCLDWNKPSIDFYHSQGAVPLDQWTTYRLSEEVLQK